jgi:general L-amino acid transport system permease protein
MRRRSADIGTRGALLWQALILLTVLAGAAALVFNTLDNLQTRGIASGFGFLRSSAGFDVTMSLIPFGEGASIARAFLVGLLNTLLVSAIGIVLATVLGFAVGFARLSPNWLLARIAGAYVEVLRNVPLLLQIFFWYFAVLRALPAPRASMALGDIAFLNNRGLYLAWPTADAGWALAGFVVATALAVWCYRTGRTRRGGAAVAGALAALGWLVFGAGWDRPALIGFNFTGGVALIPEFVALVLALSTYTASFIAEIVRAGVQSVPKGQVEAASALGLGAGDRMRFVVLPQALRVVVPPLTSQYLNLVKNSSLAAAIAYPELVSIFAGTVLNITGQAVEAIAMTMAVYLTISLVIAGMMGWYNRTVMQRGAAA